MTMNRVAHQLAAAAFGLLTLAAQAQGAGAGLEGTAWLVEDIGGHGVIDRAQTTIGFDAPGRVSGSTGCNRFTGSAAVEGDAITFGQLATTRRACVPALMDQEHRFHKAIEAVRSYSVDANGLLHLKGASGEPLLRLSPVVKEPRSTSGAAESARVTGTVSYRQRITLVPGSTVIVTLEDTSKADAPATVLGEARIPIERQQAPIPFVIEVEAGRIEPSHRYSVRARILDPQGELRWTSTRAYLVLTGGHPSSVEVQVDPVRSGAAGAGTASERPPTLVFACDGVEFLVRVGAGEVGLILSDRTVVLPQVPAASGAKYQEGSVVFWSQGNEARIEVDDTVYPACSRRLGRGLRAAPMK